MDSTEMEEWPDELAELVDHVESAIEEINSAVVAASDLDFAEVALWLEWLGDELEDLLANVSHISLMSEPTADAE
jgi:hypothetical protein